ncbi:MAG: DUF2868 domain-containing protein [Desulfuromonadaceae bacterium]|nr:DUF2868 domain-containing protein [Desulfuromonadaceae bacterium]
MTDPQPFKNPDPSEGFKPSARRSRWDIGDLIDLEYFLHGDEKENDDFLHRRDRTIFLSSPLSRQTPTPPRRILIRRWLEIRRKVAGKGTEGSPPLFPGTVFRETMNLAKWIVLALGFLFGAGLAFSLLNYRGVEPVNVSGYVSLLIGMQILFLFFLMAGSLLRRRFRRWTLTASFWGGLLHLLCRRAARAASKGLSVSFRDRFNAAFGLLKSKRSVYGNLFILPFFLISQLFGLSFNIGALIATLAKVLTSDLAFGWQTTVQVGPAAVHQLARLLALPWSWMVPEGTGYPSLQQIENSRIILKEGIAHLATTDLASWWPFLCLGLLFYGILPRFLLFLGTWVSKKIALARLDFSHAACDRLVMRMQTPLLETSHPFSAASPGNSPTLNRGFPAEEAAPAGNAPDAVALVDETLLPQAPREEVVKAGRGLFGVEITEILPLSGELRQNKQVLEQLRNWPWKRGQAGVCLIQEAWQPPILESLSFLREIRDVLPEKGKIYLLLVGKPRPETVLTPPAANDRKVWEWQLKSLADPYLGVGWPNNGA